MKNKFHNNNQGISQMYDAVFFIVLVSLSGVILLPSLQNELAINSSIDEHREITVDDTLLLLTTSKLDNFNYVYAESQIDYISSLIGLDLKNKQSLFYSIVNTLLGREQLHKTYSDLCVENLISQINVFGYRINIFTENYDKILKEKITNLLNDFLGDKYNFNLSITWYPIDGIEFGGRLNFGIKPPDDTYVAKTFVTLPNNLLSDWINKFELFLENQIEKIKEEIKNIDNNTGIKITVTNLINNTINGFLFDGFIIGNISYPGLIENIFNSIFGKIINSIDIVFDESLNILDESFSVFNFVTDYISFNESLTNFLLNIINNVTGLVNITDISDAIFYLQKFVIKNARNIFNNNFSFYINNLIESIFIDLDSLNQIDQKLNDFFKNRFNLLRANLVLTIWEVRG